MCHPCPNQTPALDPSVASPFSPASDSPSVYLQRQKVDEAARVRLEGWIVEARAECVWGKGGL